MKTHVHGESTQPWGRVTMAHHLAKVHDLTVPMAWDIGRLHQAHLEDHHKTSGGTQPPAPKAEEAAMHTHTASVTRFHDGVSRQQVVAHLASQHGVEVGEDGDIYGIHARTHAGSQEAHDHDGDVSDFHDRTDRRSVAYHLDEAHGIPREAIDVREVYAQHAAAHQPKAGDDALTEDEQDEQLAMVAFALGEGHGLSAEQMRETWNDLGQETRDHYRQHAREQLAAERERVNRPDPEDEAEDEVKADRDRRVLEDQLICVLSGISFDTVWVRDDSLSLRGAMRATYLPQARRLLGWLERGGAMGLPRYASLGEDLERERALVEDMEEINNRLRGQMRDLTEQNEGVLREAERIRNQRMEEIADLQRRNDNQAATIAAQQEVEARLRQELTREKEYAAGLALQARQLVEERASAVRAMNDANDARFLAEGKLERAIGRKLAETPEEMAERTGLPVELLTAKVTFRPEPEDALTWARKFAAGEI